MEDATPVGEGVAALAILLGVLKKKAYLTVKGEHHDRIQSEYNRLAAIKARLDALPQNSPLSEEDFEFLMGAEREVAATIEGAEVSPWLVHAMQEHLQQTLRKKAKEQGDAARLAQANALLKEADMAIQALNAESTQVPESDMTRGQAVQALDGLKEILRQTMEVYTGETLQLAQATQDQVLKLHKTVSNAKGKDHISRAQEKEIFELFTAFAQVMTQHKGVAISAEDVLAFINS